MAIGGVYITQTLISMIIMQSVPTLLRSEGFFSLFNWIDFTFYASLDT